MAAVTTSFQPEVIGVQLSGGTRNQVESDSAYATIVGGLSNVVSASFGFAAGRRAHAAHDGAVVISDSSDSEITSTAANQFTFRASGGYQFFSNGALTAGVSLASNATAWSVISDRAAKKDFTEVNSRDVLEELAAIPIQRWHYKWESADSTLNIGPVAQDFKAAFYPGRDDKSITTLEFDGVALAAIQGLNAKLEDKLAEKETEIAELRKQNQEMQRSNAVLLKRLDQIEARLK